MKATSHAIKSVVDSRLEATEMDEWRRDADCGERNVEGGGQAGVGRSRNDGEYAVSWGLGTAR